MIMHPSSVIELSCSKLGDHQVLKYQSKQPFVIPFSGSFAFCLDGPPKDTIELYTRGSKEQS